jgi:hypothetical protein
MIMKVEYAYSFDINRAIKNSDTFLKFSLNCS